MPKSETGIETDTALERDRNIQTGQEGERRWQRPDRGRADRGDAEIETAIRSRHKIRSDTQVCLHTSCRVPSRLIAQQQRCSKSAMDVSIRRPNQVDIHVGCSRGQPGSLIV